MTTVYVTLYFNLLAEKYLRSSHMNLIFCSKVCSPEHQAAWMPVIQQ